MSTDVTLVFFIDVLQLSFKCYQQMIIATKGCFMELLFILPPYQIKFRLSKLTAGTFLFFRWRKGTGKSGIEWWEIVLSSTTKGNLLLEVVMRIKAMRTNGE